MALSAYHNDPSITKNRKLTFGKVAEEYIDFKKSHGGINGVYCSCVNKNKPLFNMLFSEIKLSHLQRISDTLTPSMSGAFKTAMVSMYKYAMAHEYTATNYGELLQNQKTPQSTMHKPFSTDELKELWQNKDDNIAKIVLTMIYTGVRIQEMCNLKISDVKEDHFVGGVKTNAGKNRFIPLHDAIRPIIKSIISDDNVHVVGVTTNCLRIRMKHSHIPCIANHLPHDTRHTCETMLANAGVDIRSIQLIIGHSGGVEGLYTHKTNLQLINAINKLPVF